MKRFGGLALAAVLFGLGLGLGLGSGRDGQREPAPELTARAAPADGHAPPTRAGAPATPAPSAAAEPAAEGSALPAPSWPRPVAAIRLAFESETRDAGAIAAEQRLRAIFAEQPGSEGVLRDVRCTQTVCKLDARWSADVQKAYSGAIIRVIEEFSREMSFEPTANPEGRILPVAIYVRRAGHEHEPLQAPPSAPSP